MKKVFNLLKKVFLYARLYGISGLIFLGKRALFKNQVISFSHSSLRYPVYIRNNSSDMAVFGMIFNDLGYQCDVDFKPQVIIDCGANIGLAAVYFKNRFPEAKVIAIEPEKENFALMVKNLEQYPDVHCLQSGIWGENANLVVEDIGNGNWGWVVREVDAPAENTIPAVSISKIMEMYNLTAIDILKIDIEGSEVDVFSRNYEKWLPAVKIIIIELHDKIIQGAAKAFFETLVKYNFILAHRGECHILYMKQ
jgi:FkbM family methyltransferase